MNAIGEPQQQQQEQQQQHQNGCGCGCVSGGNSLGRYNHGSHVSNDVDLAKEMNELSVEERERVYEDIHGVGTVREETPDLLLDSIRSLDRAIASSRHKRLTRAMFLRPELEADTNFKLMFLRATEFDVKAAMKKICSYFDQKAELFGMENLVKDIALTDLTEDDLQYQTVLMQLPKDQTGRTVILMDMRKLDWNAFSFRGFLRWFWYLLTRALQDVTNQKKGILGVTYAPGTSILGTGFNRSALEFVAKSQVFARCLPYRITSLHLCLDDPRVNFFAKAIRVGEPREVRLRMRTHFGSAVELEYAMMPFGIQCEGFFQESALLHKNGQGNKNGQETFLIRFIQERMKLEKSNVEAEAEEETRSGVILYPKEKDILIGRGRTYREHPTNELWYRLIDAHVDKFMASTDRFAKTCISMHVIKIAREYEFRFLQRTPHGWTILDDATARDKAAVLLRSKARSNAADTGGGSVQTASKRRRIDPPP